MRKRCAWMVAVISTLVLPGALVGCAHDGPPSLAPEARASDGPAYPVAGFRFQISSSTPEAKALTGIPELAVTLGQIETGFVAPNDPEPTTSLLLITAPYTNYHASAIQAIGAQIAAHLQREGFDGVLVYAAEEDIDPETGRDLRAPAQLGLSFVVRAEPKPKRWWQL